MMFNMLKVRWAGDVGERVSAQLAALENAQDTIAALSLGDCSVMLHVNRHVRYADAEVVASEGRSAELRAFWLDGLSGVEADNVFEALGKVEHLDTTATMNRVAVLS